MMALKSAGAVIVGKTTTTEYGWKTPGDCPLHGLRATLGTRNIPPAAPRPARGRRGRRVLGRCISGRTRAAPCGFRRRGAGWSG